MTLALVTMIVIILFRASFCQDDSGTDLDMESMAGADAGAAVTDANGQEQEKRDLFQQSVLALQQLSIIIGNYFES